LLILVRLMALVIGVLDSTKRGGEGASN
jgi:hypothetical protein